MSGCALASQRVRVSLARSKHAVAFTTLRGQTAAYSTATATANQKRYEDTTPRAEHIHSALQLFNINIPIQHLHSSHTSLITSPQVHPMTMN